MPVKPKASQTFLPLTPASYLDLIASAKFKLGSPVRKRQGSEWHGHVVGFYSTELTPIGYCVESAFETHSVQLYPEEALLEWDGKFG